MIKFTKKTKKLVWWVVLVSILVGIIIVPLLSVFIS